MALSMPAGVSTFRVQFEAIGVNGRPIGGWFTVEPETPLVWAATGTPLLGSAETKYYADGIVDDLWLPYTDQTGFTAGVGGPPAIDWGYRFYFRPIRSRQLLTDTYVRVPSSVASPVKVANLMNIGGWPNATITIVEDGGSGDNITYTETPPGSGLYVASVS